MPERRRGLRAEAAWQHTAVGSNREVRVRAHGMAGWLWIVLLLGWPAAALAQPTPNAVEEDQSAGDDAATEAGDDEDDGSSGETDDEDDGGEATEAGGEVELDPQGPHTADGRPMKETEWVLWDAQHPDPSPESYGGGAFSLPKGWIELRRAGEATPLRVQVYGANGALIPSAIRKIESTLEDKKHKRRHRINARTIAMLYLVAQHYQRPVVVVSGYRIPERVRGAGRKARGKGRGKGKGKGKARGKGKSGKGRATGRRGKGSYHWRGSAIDFRLPGVPPDELAHFIKGQFDKTGVGVYPTSGFVHMDARERSFYWIDFSGPSEAQRLQKVEVERRPTPGADWTTRGLRLPSDMRPEGPVAPAGRGRGAAGGKKTAGGKKKTAAGKKATGARKATGGKKAKAGRKGH